MVGGRGMRLALMTMVAGLALYAWLGHMVGVELAGAVEAAGDHVVAMITHR